MINLPLVILHVNIGESLPELIVSTPQFWEVNSPRVLCFLGLMDRPAVGSSKWKRQSLWYIRIFIKPDVTNWCQCLINLLRLVVLTKNDHGDDHGADTALSRKNMLMVNSGQYLNRRT